MYIHHAKNIAEGIDYNDTGYIYNPSYPSLGPKSYPPVFPFLLSPVYKIFGLNLTAMKIEIIIFFLLFLFVYFMLFKNELPFKYLIIMIAMIGFNPFFWIFKDNVLSDIPFLLFAYISLFLILQKYRSDNLQEIQLLYPVLAGLFIYLSYGTRSIGFIFIPCLFIHDIIRYKKPTQFTAIATLVFVFFMLLQTFSLHSDRSYFDQLKGDHKIILRNINIYTDSLSQLWDNGYNRIVTQVLFIIICALTLIGYVIRIKGRVTFLEIFLPLYVGIILIWPSEQGNRFFIPVIPLFIMYTFTGITKLELLQLKKVGKLFVIILITAIFISYFGKYTKLNFGPINKGVGERDVIELFEYIKNNTDEGDVFIFRKPRVLSLYTERSAAVYQHTNNDIAVWNFVHGIGANYLITGYIDFEFMSLFIERYQNRLEERYSNSNFTVYKIKL